MWPSVLTDGLDCLQDFVGSSSLDKSKEETMSSQSEMDIFQHQALNVILPNLADYRQYLTVVQGLLKTELGRVEQIQEDVRSGKYYMDLTDMDRYEELLSTIFPNWLRSSFFTMVYTQVEFDLYESCQLAIGNLKKNNNPQAVDLEKRFREIKTFKITASKGFLNSYFKATGASFNWGISEWEELQKYEKLRNYVSHTTGALRLPDAGDPYYNKYKKVEEYVRRKQIKDDSLRWIIGPYGAGIVVFSHEFCEEVLTTAENFFKKLYNF